MNQESVSLWQGNLKLPTYPSLKSNQEVDVCIIGAGIAGLTAAYLLSKSDKSVIVLDDGPIAGGETIRTTGHLTTMLDERYFRLEQYFGKENTELAAESHRAAIELIADIVRKNQIECDFEYVNAYLYAAPGKSVDELEKELKAAHHAGITDAKMVTKAPAHSGISSPSLCFPNQAQISPLPYIHKLCDLILEQEGKIFCKTHAKNFEEKKGYFKIETDQKFTVKAKHLILATNTFTGNPIFPTKQAPYRTYAIAAEVPHGSVTKGLYYDTLDPYHYVRIAKFNNEYDMLIIGGEDHRTAQKGTIDSNYEQLERWARDRFPMIHTIKYRWSGQVIEPLDGLAFIGRSKKDSEKYFITGHSGNGLTYGTLGAILLHDLILGRPNSWGKVYDPNRIPFKNRDYLEENLNSVCQYRDWLTPGELSSCKDLKPNCGAIIRRGLKKFACYKDMHGKTHKMSAKCPHMGAIVRWNESEHCWECPAHGSRFSAEGKSLLGPANSDLEKNT